MKIIDMTCPRCGASIKPDLDRGMAECEYCGHHISIERKDTAEEVRAKAQEKEKRRSTKIKAIVIGVITLILLITVLVMELTKPQINPFDYIEVSFQGNDGKGEIVLEPVSTGENIDNSLIEFDISKMDNLFQGDTVTIHATSNDYRLTETTKVYTVEGLDEYLTDLENLSEEILDIIHAKAEASIDMDTSKKIGSFVDMKPVKLFLLSDGKQTNQLYDVFEVQLMVDGNEKTCYVLACFENVIVRDDKQISLDMGIGIYGDFISIGSNHYIFGYNSLEEVRADILTRQDSYMELKELDLS